jgi:hypothetical protein
MEIKSNKYDYKIIVSSLLSNINNNRKTSTYIEYGKKILYESHVHVILFIENICAYSIFFGERNFRLFITEVILEHHFK